MDIKIYNTLSHKKEKFIPLKKGVMTMYNCGPTVYDVPHIGNYRTFIMNDIIRRTFSYLGYEVIQAMNITDVDDKTIHRSHEEKVALGVLTQKYENLFLEGLNNLNILQPNKLIHATKYIPAMISLIEQLIGKGVAYKSEDGVYMSINKVKNYGELAGLNISNPTKTKARISNDEYDKNDPHDFALWKFTTKDDGDISWEAPFGKGRPGWHIECSAMAMDIFGPTIDIHTGGADLIFPHHTNEIAQSESATDQKFANYWMHGAFITITDEKMAKSRGNFLKLSDLNLNEISPLSYRYWLMTAHYRSPVNFSYEAVRASQQALIRLMTTIAEYPAGGKINTEYQEKFKKIISDDMDMPKAIALVWDIIKDPKVSEADKRATIVDFDKVFGLKLDSVPESADEEIPVEILVLSEARDMARQEKDWAKADALRQEIEDRGYTLKDTDNGVKIVRH